MACNVLSGPVGLLHTEAAMIQTTLTLPQAHVFVLKCETLQVTEFEFALIICVYIYIYNHIILYYIIIISYYTKSIHTILNYIILDYIRFIFIFTFLFIFKFIFILLYHIISYHIILYYIKLYYIIKSIYCIYFIYMYIYIYIFIIHIQTMELCVLFPTSKKRKLGASQVETNVILAKSYVRVPFTAKEHAMTRIVKGEVQVPGQIGGERHIPWIFGAPWSPLKTKLSP